MITFGSLFSGIGGIDLGLERAGLKCVWQSEIDPYACRVLAKHWPDIPNLGDIRGIDWTTVDRADLVAGGYPCQPFSIAGRRAGADDPDNLWPYFAECLRVLRPRYALLENVPNHLSLGFGPVLGDLAALGYDTEWDCLPAAAVGAPHLRDRLFAIARHAGTEHRRTMADRDHPRPDHPLPARRDASGFGGSTHRPKPWTPEPDLGRVANGIPHRLDRIRTLGNAVVPQVAEHLAHIILEMETRP
jgi:DNA (cytosine-5)-methyltransferase 1